MKLLKLSIWALLTTAGALLVFPAFIVWMSDLGECWLSYPNRLCEVT